MKVKYFAALAAASVVGMTALTGCSGDTTTETIDPAATEVAPDADGMMETEDGAAMNDGMMETEDGAAMNDGMMDKEAEPCAAK